MKELNKQKFLQIQIQMEKENLERQKLELESINQNQIEQEKLRQQKIIDDEEFKYQWNL